MTTLTVPTSDEVKEFNASKLRELGMQLGLTAISRTPKAVLQQMVLDAIESQNNTEQSQPSVEEVEEEEKRMAAREAASKPSADESTARPKKTVEVAINDKHRAIIDNNDISKSEKMRRLWKKGMSIADIHRVLSTHYSFTYGVIDRFRKILEARSK